jgi:hypothetical protein
MNILLWCFQGLLAVIMLMAGSFKLTKTKSELKQKNMEWVDSVSAGSVKLIGFSQLLISFGLILPQLLGILPWLTPLAALGLVLEMLGAIILHIRRRDPIQASMPSIIFVIIATFVAYGRFVLIPA